MDAHDEAAKALWTYIDKRYIELEDEQIDGHQLVALTEGAIKTALRKAAADERRRCINEVCCHRPGCSPPTGVSNACCRTAYYMGRPLQDGTTYQDRARAKGGA